jgi:hypothetical protein
MQERVRKNQTWVTMRFSSHIWPLKDKKGLIVWTTLESMKITMHLSHRHLIILLLCPINDICISLSGTW